jgi:DNA modification methylase
MAETTRRHDDRGTSTLTGSNAEQMEAGTFTAAHATCSKCGAWRGPFGLEPTPELYVEHTVQVLREVRRVLRSDGVVWWNLGDTFFGSWGNHGARNGKQRTSRKERYPRDAWEGFTGRPPMAGSHSVLKHKDLCAIPFCVALAAQRDGWWLRSVIVWEKVNAMPESVKDRPTESHEYVLLLTKSERYFYDADAVREPHQEASVERVQRRWAAESKYDENDPQLLHSWMRDRSDMRRCCHPGGRNMRTVWRFATYPYSGAHFAVFPPELPRRCILAGTPPKACATCGAPWKRIIQRDAPLDVPEVGPNSGEFNKPPYQHNNPHRARLEPEPRERDAFYTGRTVGWEPTCECHGRAEAVITKCTECDGSGTAMDADACVACAGTGSQKMRVWPEGLLARWPTRPAIVLDPFAGSGTTLMVAEDLGRWWIGVDICEDYLPQIQKRTAQRSLAGAFENATV